MRCLAPCRSIATLLGLAALACAGGSAPPDAVDAPGDGPQDTLADAPDALRDTPPDAPGDAPPADLPTGFRVTVAEQVGANQDGVGDPHGFLYVANPPATELPPVVTARSGDCAFVEPEWPGTCEPFCPWPGYCGADDRCHEGLPQRFAGDIALSGLKADCTLPMVASGSYRYYQSSCVPESPADLFDGGATVAASAAGGDDLPAFTLQTLGVEPVDTDLPCTGFALQAGQPLDVAWTPAGQPGDRVRFWLVSGNHGTQFGHVECETGDTGFLRVDASLVDLHRAAFNPVPTWRLERFHAEGLVVDGTRVVLEASAGRSCNYGY